ncbi:MAG: 4-hydroxythreonine-4-phosphate dehydrogenase PdxA [Candidatus Hydrogenedentes bacterium]|nr:4-hydroxythreonine-4-phosphate dehydrogenase PdxA [Candidatus Hydrogenedentota bacterium]
MKPKLAITMGDINGIGPEILVKALARPDVQELCEPVVLGSARVLETARDHAPLCPPATLVTDFARTVLPAGSIPVIEGPVPIPEYHPGRLDPQAGRCAVEWVKQAVGMALARKVAGVVTCPINKEGIHLAGYDYAGHTELVAELTNTRDYRLCLFADQLRIVHNSTHCSLIEAIRLVKADRIAVTIRLGHAALVRLGFARPRIAIAGVNPHAGEAGAFGREEIDELRPAIERCSAEGIECSGPHPPDTVFLRMLNREFDMAVAMYHDQGHIPLKLVAMDSGVNTTLGTPIIRTSVDHGTAYDIAGKGVAREESLCAAIRLAVQFAEAERS